MGGIGSGPRCHYWRAGKMRLCEESWKLDSARWQSEGRFTSPSGTGYAHNDGSGCLPVSYRNSSLSMTLGHAGAPFQYGVPIENFPTRIASRFVYYWQCPLGRHGAACHRRCRILFLPPGEAFFGCRGCHGLTYRSTQKAGCNDLRHAAVLLAGNDPLLATMLQGWRE